MPTQPRLHYVCAMLLLGACLTILPFRLANAGAASTAGHNQIPHRASTLAPAATTSPTATLPAGRVPLSEALSSLEPQAVWQNFYDLTQIPRPSHHEEQVSAFLADFGRELGLETIVDDVGNVIIRKPAAQGMDGLTGVVLQAHMDMVPQQTADSTHDFLTDPIEAYVEDGWVKADNTTLGADDGIGVATIMAVLQDPEAVHGPLEALFTVNEEDGFTGVYGLQPNVLQGKILINLDSEAEGVFTIGSAGGVYLDATATYTMETAPADRVGYTVSISGLQGGHSGVDINKNRGNANRLLLRLLWSAQDQFDLRLATITGGDVYNAITREASAIVALPADRVQGFTKFVEQYGATIRDEYAATEPDLIVTSAPADLPEQFLPHNAQHALLSALYGSANGVQKMSDAVPDLVETSTSLGILELTHGELTLGHYIRSAVDSERDDLEHMLISVFELGGLQTSDHDAYSGWTPNPDSPILLLMQSVYTSLFAHAAEVNAIHAGLETSVIGATYPDMDMISIGPTLVSVHTPDESLEVASVSKVYSLLLATLKQIPAAQ